MEIVSDSTTSATLSTSGSLSIMSSKGGSISIGTIKEEKAIRVRAEDWRMAGQ